MEYLSKAAGFIGNIFKNHKSKLALTFVSFLLFSLLLFPFDDLSNLVSNRVNGLFAQPKMKPLGLFLDFDGMSLSLPVGIKMSDVKLESAKYPTIKVGDLKVNQSVAGALAQRPDLSIKASEIFSGSISANYEWAGKVKDDKSDPPLYYQEFEVRGEELAMGRLKKILGLPFKPNGQLQFNVLNGKIDPSFRDQPQLDAEIEITGYKNAAFSIPIALPGTPPSSFPLPAISADKILAVANLAEGKLTFESFEMGQAKDPVTLRIKAGSSMRLNFDRNMRAQLGSFDITAELGMSDAVAAELAILELYLAKTRTDDKKRKVYRFRASGQSLRGTPDIAKARPF